MIASAVAWLVKLGVSERWAKAILAAAVVVVLLLALRLWFSAHDASVVDRHETKVQLDVQTQGRAADEQMRGRVAASEAAITQAREEFDHASAAMPAERLTRRQRLDLCIELRDAGTDTTVIPECVDLHSGAATGAVDRHPAQR